jgi:hypothetical protein
VRLGGVFSQLRTLVSFVEIPYNHQEFWVCQHPAVCSILIISSKVFTSRRERLLNGFAMNRHMREKMTRILFCLCLAFQVAGCGGNIEGELGRCVAETDPVVRVRLLQLWGLNREDYDSCKASKDQMGSYCEALYLNAGPLVRTCMQKHGYLFATDRCPDYPELKEPGVRPKVYSSHLEKNCYDWNWYSKFRGVF